MIVVDASVVVAGLLLDEHGSAAREALANDDVHAPHLLDVEVASVIRRAVLAGRLTPLDARAAVADLRDLAVSRHDHALLLERVLELGDALSAYDALYVALAEVLDATLMTADARSARAPGIRCLTTVVSST